MCQHFNSCTYGGGKNRKADKHRGRPSGEVPKRVLEHAIQSAPDQLVPQDDPEPILFECATTTTEPRTQILDRPIQLVCGTIICLRCCVSWIQYHHPPLSCPCCYFQLDSAHIRPPPPLVLSLVEGVLVQCVRGCGIIVKLGQYQLHLNGACQSHYHQLANSPSKVTISEVLSKPSTSPATPAEVKVAEHLVRKIMDQSSGDAKGVFKIPRRGQVSKLI